MAEPESEPGFTFVDKRRRGEDSVPHEAPAARPASPPPSREPVAPAEGPPRPDLASLCAMLYSEALVHLGQVPDPTTGHAHLDLDRTRFTIDMLSMIGEKTEGNRTAEETAILDEILATLRMAFVRASRLA